MGPLLPVAAEEQARERGDKWPRARTDGHPAARDLIRDAPCRWPPLREREDGSRESALP
jgi:hypothetical protein